MKKIFLVGALCCLSANVSANLVLGNATVTFGGITPGYDNSALTSSLLTGVDATDLGDTGLTGVNNQGIFVETFDTITNLGTNLTPSPFGPVDTSFNSTSGDNSGCSVNSAGAGVNTTGSLSVRKNDLTSVAVIGYQDNCFGYTPEDGQGSGSVNLDFNPILASSAALTGMEMGIDYFGFYWATIDTYNTFTFRNDGLDVLVLTGQDLIDALSGLQRGRDGQYVNVYFNDGIFFDELNVLSTVRAAEFDNIVNRITAVPEPSIFAIFALGIMGLVSRRFKKQS